MKYQIRTILAAMALFVVTFQWSCGNDGLNQEGGSASELEQNVNATNSCKEPLDGKVDFAIDELPHEEALEWWYWTGHLKTEDQRWFGFEMVVFLISTGSMGNILMSHHALTDIQNQKFEYDVKFAPYLQKAEQKGFDFTVGAFSMKGADGHDVIHGELPSSTLDLELLNTKRPVLQHGNGYHDYPFGGYTYYYTRPRMEAIGTIKIDGESHRVVGTAWFDHQWGSLGNATDSGWDWFALQLDDGTDIMATRVHKENQPLMFAGSINDSECNTKDLDESNITIIPKGTWESPTSGCVYPMGWDLEINGKTYTITPVMDDQELVSREKTYWEGAAIVGGAATGRAYIELVGYCPTSVY